jgi:hypothetical protein
MKRSLIELHHAEGVRFASNFPERETALLRKGLYARAGMGRKEAFNFHAVRCDRVVKNVLERIQKQSPKTGNSVAKTQ